MSFDRYRDSYGDEVDRAVAFARADAELFTELKALDLIQLIQRHFSDGRTVRALDFGCGTGALDAPVAPHVASIVGVDVSQGLLDAAKQANPHVEYRHYDGRQLPYPDASFDLAFASCVFHHIEPTDRHAAAAEVARVVRPGGVVALYEHNPINPLTRLAVSRCAFDTGVDLLGAASAQDLLVEAGLQPVEMRFIVFFPWRGRLLRATEKLLARLALGAQYVVVATKIDRAK